MQAPTHIFFDFFGTLVHYSPGRVTSDHQRSYGVLVENGFEGSYRDYLDQWDSVFLQFEARASKSLDEFTMNAVGSCFLDMVLPAAPGADVLATFRDTYLEEWSRQVVYIPGVNDMLDQLAATHRLAVISNTHHAELVHDVMVAAGMTGYFEDLVTSDKHGRRKPCPTIFEYALARAGTDASAATFVGDSHVHDYAGAKAAGLRPLLIDPGRAHDIPEAHRLEHILDVPRAIGSA